MPLPETPTSFLDCNLPELLACDLENSSTVFLSRQLTAGMPLRPSTDDWTPRRHSSHDSPINVGFSSQFRQRPCLRVRSLEALDAQYAQVLWPNKAAMGPHFDSETGSSGSSGCLEMPSSRTRPASPVTPATSVASERRSPSPVCLNWPFVQKSPEKSWIDLGDDQSSEDESADGAARRHSTGHVPRLQPLLCHEAISGSNCKPTRSSLSSLFPLDLSEPREIPATMTMDAMAVDRLSSLKLSSTIKDPATLPARNSSLTHQLESSLPFTIPPRAGQSPVTTISDSSDDSSSADEPERAPPLPFRSPRRGLETWSAPKTAAPPETYDFNQQATDDDAHFSQHRSKEQGPPSSAIPTQEAIEHWLNSTLGAFSHYPDPTANGLGSRLPLPPDVLETLRVSVSCFPETMLLCSSLSIETIRGHSHKLKYKSGGRDPEAQLAALEEPPTSKSSRWKRIASAAKRSPLTTHHSRHSIQRRAHHCETQMSVHSGVSKESNSTPDWVAIKNIFPSGTDYLCDALYAHLVAYNYITSLCPRSSLIAASIAPPAKPPIIQNDNHNTPCDKIQEEEEHEHVTEGNKIPRKAASLLGLQNGPYTTTERKELTRAPSGRRSLQSTLRGKKSFNFNKHVRIEEPEPEESPAPIPRSVSSSGNIQSVKDSSTMSTLGTAWSAERDTYVTAAPAGCGGMAHGGEQALADLRLGIARCIARLVATLRLTGFSAETSTRVNEEGPLDFRSIHEVDPLFLRALCEIVRCAEAN